MEDLLHFDLEELIKTVGLLGVYAIIFAESGLLIGFFLPGDSLLFTAGFLASQGFLNFPALAIGCFVAAVAGDTVGYWFGHKVGRSLFNREDSRLFKKKYLIQAEGLYHHHGGKIIVIARFMPIVRTFAPIVAGMGTMHYPRFLSYNAVGGFLWGVGVSSAGYFLGKSIPNVDRYLLPIIFLIVVISVLPPATHVLRDYLKERKAKQEMAATEPDPELS
ncbi:MAG: VTT domain-containing protein [Anaerolineae bacterium]|nr:VTT domain-containing protein [Anaerolineae bacterium]